MTGPAHGAWNPAPPPPIDPGSPVAEIEQAGWRTYRIAVIHGGWRSGPDGGYWIRPGRRLAERKARRELAKYLRNEVRRENRWTING